MVTDVPEGFPMRLPREVLVGLDGLDTEENPSRPAATPPRLPATSPAPLTLSAESSARLKAEIEARRRTGSMLSCARG